jgi:hypothetical protein
MGSYYVGVGDGEDMTAVLQGAIDSPNNEIIVTDIGRPWIISETLRLRSNQRIHLEAGVRLEAKEGAFLGTSDCLIQGQNVSNIVITGGPATLRMRREDYKSDPYPAGEWRHCLDLRGCTNVLIQGVRCEFSGGDGIYIGPWISATERKPCRDIGLYQCKCQDNHRNGLSITACDRFLADDCRFSGTSGTKPQAGVDLEPNSANDLMRDIRFTYCQSMDNEGSAWTINVSRHDSSSIPATIRFEECRVTGGYGAAFMFRSGEGTRSQIQVIQGAFRSTEFPGLWFVSESPCQDYIIMSQCLWSNVARSASWCPIDIIAGEDGARLRFSRCRIIDDMARPFAKASGTQQLRRVSGTLMVPIESALSTIDTLRFPYLRVSYE